MEKSRPSSNDMEQHQSSQPFGQLSPSCIRAPPPISPTLDCHDTPFKNHDFETHPDSDSVSVNSWNLVQSDINPQTLEREEKNSFPRERLFWNGDKHDVDDDAEWSAHTEMLCETVKPGARKLVAKLQDFVSDIAEKGAYLDKPIEMIRKRSRRLVQPPLDIRETDESARLLSSQELETAENVQRLIQDNLNLQEDDMKTRNKIGDDWIDVGTPPKTV